MPTKNDWVYYVISSIGIGFFVLGFIFLVMTVILKEKVTLAQLSFGLTSIGIAIYSVALAIKTGYLTEETNRMAKQSLDIAKGSEIIAKQPYTDEVIENYKVGYPIPLIAEQNEFAYLFGQEIQAAMLGQKTAREAVKSATRQMKEMFEQAGYYK